MVGPLTITLVVPLSSQFPSDEGHTPGPGSLGYGITFAMFRRVPSSASVIGPAPKKNRKRARRMVDPSRRSRFELVPSNEAGNLLDIDPIVRPDHAQSGDGRSSRRDGRYRLMLMGEQQFDVDHRRGGFRRNRRGNPAQPPGLRQHRDRRPRGRPRVERGTSTTIRACRSISRRPRFPTGSSRTRTGRGCTRRVPN